MRIISGIAKGKKITIPMDKKTRPLKDRVRESIFNIIEHSNLFKLKFNQSTVLDLFSGVGSFGLEAISRGAKKVVFIENYKPVIKLLIENINSLSFNDKSEIYTKDIYYIKSFEEFNYKFNLIFLDPPFKDANIKIIIDNLIKSKIADQNTFVIIHRFKKTIDNFDNNLKIIREEIYGSSKIIFGYFNL